MIKDSGIAITGATDNDYTGILKEYMSMQHWGTSFDGYRGHCPISIGCPSIGYSSRIWSSSNMDESTALTFPDTLWMTRQNLSKTSLFSVIVKNPIYQLVTVHNWILFRQLMFSNNRSWIWNDRYSHNSCNHVKYYTGILKEYMSMQHWGTSFDGYKGHCPISIGCPSIGYSSRIWSSIGYSSSIWYSIGNSNSIWSSIDCSSSIWSTVFTVFRLLTDFVCYEFWLSLCKIVRSSVILLLPLFNAMEANKINDNFYTGTKLVK
jgi:hypothetical protein